MNSMRFVYGPVPSRRLGISLGISPIPKKTCNYSCVYCQLGRTDKMTNIRKMFFPVHSAILEIVQPEVIFAVGLDTYKIIKKFFQFEQSGSFPSGHSSWPCLIAQRQYKQKLQKLIGFPHFSRYALRYHDDVLSRVARECR